MMLYALLVPCVAWCVLIVAGVGRCQHSAVGGYMYDGATKNDAPIWADALRDAIPEPMEQPTIDSVALAPL